MFLLQPCVYYKRKIFKNDALQNLSEEFISEFYADTFSDCPSNIYTSVSEDGSSSEYSSDSDSVNVIPTKRKTLVIDSDPESKNETHGAGKCSFASAKECRRYFTKIGRLNRCVRYNC